MIALCIVSALLLITNAAWWLLWNDAENEIKRLKSRDHEEWIVLRHRLRETFRKCYPAPGWGPSLLRLITDVEQNRR